MLSGSMGKIFVDPLSTRPALRTRIRRKKIGTGDIIMIITGDKASFRGESMTEENAREIMGKNFLDVSRVAAVFVRNGSRARRELESLRGFFEKVPFSADRLMDLRKTHCLVAVPPVSMNWLFAHAPQLFRSAKGGWLAWRKSPIAEEGGTSAWWLVRKSPEPDSLGIHWADQKKLAGDRGICIPTPRVMVYLSVASFLVNGTRLFGKTSVCCSGAGSPIRWLVGNFNEDGIAVLGYYRDGYSPTLGLASAEKPNVKIPR